MDDADKEAKRKTAYKSRLSRARTANLEKRGLTSQRTDESESMANMAFSIPVQQEVDMEALGNKRAATWSNPSTPQSAKPTKTVKKIETEITTFAKPDSEESIAAHWEWNSTQKLLAVAEQTQLLKVIDESGKTIYRVQVSRQKSTFRPHERTARGCTGCTPLLPCFIPLLRQRSMVASSLVSPRLFLQLPREGRTIFLGWEPSGAALAAVQDHGGAFLWFPSKPDCVQQWEGMQFSSQMMRSSALKRNSHFDTCFASWSETRKLVLGLADGNFACWDLQSNETFISRKHFAGKHKGAITCGAWGMKGQVLALGSKNQLKLSAPLLNASWEATAAKLALPDNELSFQELSFSPSGNTLSALAGTSIFRHLCLYSVTTEQVKEGKKMVERPARSPGGEMRPDATMGGIQVKASERASEQQHTHTRTRTHTRSRHTSLHSHLSYPLPAPLLPLSFPTQAVVWLDNEMVACVTSNGYLRLLQYSVGEGILVEDQHKPASSGVTAACLLKKTGHIAIVSPNLVTFFDPLLLEVAATMEIPMPPDGARNSKLQACPSGKLLILGRTDGVILRIPLPELNKIDLTLLAVRSGIGGEAVTPGNGNGESQAGGVLCASCGTPNLVLQCTAADGAASGYGSKLHHAWSQQRGLLALVNSRNQAVVIQRNTDGTSSTLLKEQLPEASIVSVSWDPSTQSVLAIAIRHYGIALWDTKSDAGIQMWSGMAYKSGIIPFSKSTRAFDPVFTSWNLAGQ